MKRNIIKSLMIIACLSSCTNHFEDAHILDNKLPIPLNLSVTEPTIEMIEVTDQSGKVISIDPVVTLTAKADGAIYFGIKTSSKDVSPIQSTDGLLKVVYPGDGLFKSIVYAQGYQKAIYDTIEILIPTIPDIPLPDIDISDYYTFTDEDVNISTDGFITGIKKAITNKKIIIPRDINGLVLKGIAKDALRSAQITHLDFRLVENGFEIGEAALRSSKLEYLRITKNISEIGSSSFRQCANLVKVDFEGNNLGLTAIGESAFRETALESFEVPRFITTLQPSIFRKCLKLKTFNFQKGSQIEFIGSNMFFECMDVKASLPYPEYEGFTHWVDQNGDSWEPGATIGMLQYSAVLNN